uniref:Uncharacterized protein n=1 Tax=viral metagenome TaxID=1070528 RepID=A0A6C0D389_9ZZZZ
MKGMDGLVGTNILRGPTLLNKLLIKLKNILKLF